MIKFRDWEPGDVTVQLNAYGKDGWELVNFSQVEARVVSGSGGGTYKLLAVFKRKI